MIKLIQKYFKYQTDEWRRKKLNEWYTHNKELDFMTVHDRALWILSIGLRTTAGVSIQVP